MVKIRCTFYQSLWELPHILIYLLPTFNGSTEKKIMNRKILLHVYDIHWTIQLHLCTIYVHWFRNACLPTCTYLCFNNSNSLSCLLSVQSMITFIHSLHMRVLPIAPITYCTCWLDIFGYGEDDITMILIYIYSSVCFARFIAANMLTALVALFHFNMLERL